jgi:hypothetical protein
MTSLFKQFKSDEDLEKNGILLEYGYVDGPDGKPDLTRPICIRIARAGGANSKFAKRFDIKTKPYRRQIQTETIDKDIADKVMREVYAETVVLGWENVQDEQGNDIPFSVPNCVDLFERLPGLFSDIQEQSQRAVLFRSAVREVDSGN